MGMWNNYLPIPGEVLKKLPFLGEPYYCLFRNSTDKVLRGVIFEMTEVNFEKACKRLAGEMTGEILSGDKVYVLPNCRIPRFRIKDYTDSIGASLTGDMTQATKIIGHDKVKGDIGGMSVLVEPGYSLFSSEFRPDSWYTKNRPKEALKQREEFENAIGAYEDIFSGITAEDILIGTSMLSPTIRTGNFERDKVTSGKYITPTGALIIYNQILRKVPILSEDLIFQKIGKPIAIDKDSFQSLYDMLDSPDESNHKIAAEIMANSDIENSLFYIWKMAAKFSWKVRDLSKFKNVRLFIKMSDWNKLSGLDAEAAIEYLYGKGVLTQEFFNELITYAARKYTARMDSPVFKVVLEPSDKYKNFRAEAHRIDFTREVNNIPVEVEEVYDDDTDDGD